MGIQVEFNPDLALRDMQEHRVGKRLIEECIPEPLEVGKTYPFLKLGQRNYWFGGELPLLRTEGSARLSRPVASIVIIESTHFTREGEIWTKGKFEVRAVFEPTDPKVQFESYARRV